MDEEKNAQKTNRIRVNLIFFFNINLHYIQKEKKPSYYRKFENSFTIQIYTNKSIKWCFLYVDASAIVVLSGVTMGRNAE